MCKAFVLLIHNSYLPYDSSGQNQVPDVFLWVDYCLLTLTLMLIFVIHTVDWGTSLR